MTFAERQAIDMCLKMAHEAALTCKALGDAIKDLDARVTALEAQRPTLKLKDAKPNG